ncbi:hypothetical protein CLCR_09360 [Cladophialophora carrionii]|uniref:Uncharacterized protein n=1 Tax=Cladophialophora carrionii TaxID=86049 RepID=A0A1C1CU82_9EURO|nr:hypothetical protein CLCR_09360 [Cladophialophora carrionii]
MANLVNKAKDVLTGGKTHHDTATTSSAHGTTGTHHSAAANTLDPTVGTTTGPSHTAPTHHKTTAGPHSSNLMNRADPRVE